MTNERCLPHPELREFVREYWYRVDDLGDRTLKISLPARAERFLEFNLGDRYEVHDPPAPRGLGPVAAVVGTQAIQPIEVFLRGRLRVFIAHFHPTGFHRLFGVPMTLLAGTAFEASDLLGSGLERFRQRLGEESDLPTMAGLMNGFLRPHAARHRAVDGPTSVAVERAARQSILRGGAARLDALVEASGLGMRQFERRFKAGTGISPKRYLRVTRFHQAIGLKQAHPSWSWRRVAAEADYHDQMHLVHDFRALAGEPPRRLLESMDGREDGLLTVERRMSVFY